MTPSALNAQPLTATASDVVSVTIDVTQGANVLQAGVPLTLSGSTWSGAIGNLPATVPLTFTAHAYDFTHTEIYSGSDTTTLSAMALNSVAINLALIPGGILALPQIVSIRLPSLIASATSATIQVQVAGSANDTLTWSLTAPTGGGSFNPASGSQTLSASGTGSFSVTFIAPVLLSTYTETVQVTNSQNNGVLATFPIQVSGVAGVVTLQFPPVVTGILGSRSGSTLTWTASALGDLSCCDFTWSASLTGGIAPGFGAPATTNPAFLEGYDQTVNGTIFVQVSDGTGLSSTAILGLPAGEFPDTLVVPLSLN
jgi:hypothetical protein